MNESRGQIILIWILILYVCNRFTRLLIFHHPLTEKQCGISKLWRHTNCSISLLLKNLHKWEHAIIHTKGCLRLVSDMWKLTNCIVRIYLFFIMVLLKNHFLPASLIITYSPVLWICKLYEHLWAESVVTDELVLDSFYGLRMIVLC